MKILFVHGRAQGGKAPAILKKQWLDTLNIGLAKSALVLPVGDEEVIFPYYGDRLDELVNEINQPIEGVVQRGAGFSMAERQFFHDFLMEIAENGDITISEIQENLPEGVLERGPLNWAWVQAILRAIDKRDEWGELVIKKFTHDVFLYLTIPGIRDVVNKIVSQCIADEPCIVVAHSLGTIIAYNILRDNPGLKIAKFITLGSPLGLNAVKKYLRTPILMPQCIDSGWFNAFDDRDVVALNPLNKTYFNVDPAIVNKNDVHNQTDNRHGIEGYLNDQEVARQIYSALLPLSQPR